MHTLISHLITLLFHNQNMFASGGLLLMLIGSIGAALRKIPVRIWEFIVNQTTISVTITDESEAFRYFKHWFNAHESAKKFRRIDAYTPIVNGWPRIYPTPAPGRHYLWHKKRLMSIIMSRSEEKKGSYNASRSENYFIRTLGRDQKFLVNFLHDAQKVFLSTYEKTPRLRVATRDGWEGLDNFSPRPLNTVIMPEHQKEAIVQDIQNFKKSKTWYTQAGIPYRRGYLLKGLPGTGKTSIVNGIAHEFSMSVHTVNLSEMSDSSLASACREMEANSILLLEDIDAAVKTRELQKSAEVDKADSDKLFGVTLSGLLNVLDGINSPSGVLVFMTTNHAERLDPALIRPGRCDVKISFGPATRDQKLELYSRFFTEDSEAVRVEFVDADTSVTMSDLQERLLNIRSDRMNEKTNL